MSLDSIYRDGVAKVWEKDAVSQKNYLDIVSKTRNMPSIDFKSLNAFFIPNDDYVPTYFGEEIRNREYGFYDDSAQFCYWNNCLVIPIHNVADKIVSVVGFNPFRYVEAKENQDWSINYYIYASASHFKKGSHLFYLEGCFSRAMDEGYLFLTDGIFDTVSMQLAGFNTAALMGSSLTQELSAILRFIDRLIIVIDNDEAGQKLANDIKRAHKNVTIVKQGVTKDVDDLLKSDKREIAIAELRKAQECRTSYYTLNV